ncbi:MAG: hypothetical protein CVU50_07120 [Candidatus Cloacimonetes bacterium HGW-Cloacimonetes-3]|jgi:hypothetical protein|nr:MAG: hypothetical protein CVU50_07120 [Candidatus Cloacimonetes bacterium HGW-Cloacimonetes-3]
MINRKIEGFLEKVDMNYLFCLLSKLEAQRLNQFPTYVKHKFPEKITVMAMEHVADNEVPDYITELAEAELAMQQAENPFDDDEGFDFIEETIDDSDKFIEEIKKDSLDDYDDEEEDFFGEPDDTEDSDI